MKKTIVYAAIAALSLACVQPAAAAAATTENIATANTALDSEFVSSGELEQLTELDLDAALKRAVEDSYNLALLQLKYDALGRKQKDLTDQAEDLTTEEIDPYFVPNTAADIMANYQISAEDPSSLLWLGPVTENNIVTNQLMAGMANIVEGMNELIESQRNQAEVAAKQMENNKWNTALDQAEAKEGIALQMTAEYVQLLAKQKQIVLTEDYAAVLNNDLIRAQKLNQAGLSSGENMTDLEQAIKTQNEQLAALKNNYQLGLIQLAFDLGIEYNPELQLKDLDYEVPAAAVRMDTDIILANAFEMKRLYNNINQAEWEQKNTDTKNYSGEVYLQLSVEIAQQKAEQAKVDLSKRASAIYTSADNVYNSYATEARTLEEGLADYEKMKTRYNNGFISKHDLTKFEFQLRQYETKTAIAMLQAFVNTKQVEAMERGFIQMSS